MARSKHTVEQKLAALQMLEVANYSMLEVCRLHSISFRSLQIWKIKYDREGIKGLKNSVTWKAYSKELKTLAA